MSGGPSLPAPAFWHLFKGTKPRGCQEAHMNSEAIREIVNELFSHLERLETQSEAILQFLKEKKRVTDKQLAPYLEQAGNASNVKWRAARVRIDHLLEPEHPEEEIKLGKKPELHEDSSSAGSSEEQRSESDAEEGRQVEPGKRTESGDQKQIEASDSNGQRAKLDNQTKAAPAEAAQARSANSKDNKPEAKSEVEQKNSKQAVHDQRAQKSDSGHHPAEVS